MATLSIALATSVGTPVDLTALGSRDWIRWDGATTLRKAGAVALCRDFCETASALLGPAAQTVATSGPAVTFSDGTPTGSGSSAGCLKGLFQKGAGYVFCFYADTTTRTAILVCPGFDLSNTTLRATAVLSDGSAAPVTLTFGTTSSSTDVITVTYAAAAVGEVLYVVLANNTKDLHPVGIAAIAATGTGGVVAGAPTDAPVVPNPSFEGSLTGNWTVQGPGVSGVGANGDPTFPAATDGTHFMIVGCDAGGTQGFSDQSITFPAGKYILGCGANQSGTASPQTIGWSVDGTVIATGFHDNYGKDNGYQKFASNIFSVTAGAHTVKLYAEVETGTAVFSCVDSVTLLRLPDAGGAPPPPPPPPPPPAGTTVSVPLVSPAGAVAASLSGLKWAFFDQLTPNLFTAAPTAKGAAGTTDASGICILTITGTALGVGAVGFLIVTNTAGVPATQFLSFAGPVTVS